MTDEHTNQPAARQLLVQMLEQATQLEHCLLDSYLYTACSLKSTPQEFETVDGKPNRRRAIHFERVRAWKQALLGVAREEMLHLHYVECLRRALGERPALSLPPRDPQTGSWRVAPWQARVGERVVNDGKGVSVPIGPLTPKSIQMAVLYESTDSLQNEDPFGEGALELFEQLYAFEQDLHFERILYKVDDDGERNRLKGKLRAMYTELLPLEVPEAPPPVGLKAAVSKLPSPEELRFQSIADFYYKGVQPLYAQAFDRGWVVNTNYLLNNELLEPGYADEGFLPVGPVHRDKNFERFATANTTNPIKHFKRVEDIIREIVVEGEGAVGFRDNALALLKWYANNGGDGGAARKFQQALDLDQGSSEPTPAWLAKAQLLRKSHLYRFAMIMVGLEEEQALAKAAGVEFNPARTPVATANNVPLQLMRDELPAQFNACYLVLVSWLARIYEVQHWEADKPRRMAIEMIASWPLMSMAIRPLLELTSFFDTKRTELFRLGPESLPMLPIHAQQLQRLYAAAERSQETNEEMDYLAVRVLEDVATWAASKIEICQTAGFDPNTQSMIVDRLAELSHLDEFRKQFPFRVAGGYSNRTPDEAFQRSAPEPTRFEESPGGPGGGFALFDQTLALRLRFSGWGRVQLATDPDPTWDEVGCTGTHMMHAADGNRRFDRALVWQDGAPATTFTRQPVAELPMLGVQGVDAALMVAPSQASAGYVPLRVLESSGAVQTSGVQSRPEVHGLYELMSIDAGSIVPGTNFGVELMGKGGAKPFLNGLNHLVWRDGEPIDPFVFRVQLRDQAGQGPTQFEREIFNEGYSLLEMSPLQRLESSRAPVGFDSVSNVPPWALQPLTESQRHLLSDPNYPLAWLDDRAQVLCRQLALSIADPMPATASQGEVDTIVSYAERMRLVSVPRGTTVGWLRVLLHYGHTLSGATKPVQENAVLAAFAKATGLRLSITPKDERDVPNSRWFVQYTKGVMDTDSLSDLVFGELYIPLSLDNADKIHIEKIWHVPVAMRSIVADYACRFDHPFWSDHVEFNGDRTTRTLPLPDGGTVTETLQGQQRPDGYEYTLCGVDGLTTYQGKFRVGEPGASGQLPLIWSVGMSADQPQVIVKLLGIVALAADVMTRRMHEHFTPR